MVCWDHRRGVVGKTSGIVRQVADVAIGHAEGRDDAGMVGCNGVEIAH